MNGSLGGLDTTNQDRMATIPADLNLNGSISEMTKNSNIRRKADNGMSRMFSFTLDTKTDMEQNGSRETNQQSLNHEEYN